MSDYKNVVALTDDLPESSYSGLSDLPEVKDPVGWLQGSTSRSGFRSMILDDVIPQRKELPEWATTIDDSVKQPYLLSEKPLGGEQEKLNKVGEAFYKLKDGFANTFTNLPKSALGFIAAKAKTYGIMEDEATKALENIVDFNRSEDFERAYQDFRMGVDPDFVVNQLAESIGTSLGLGVMAVATGGGALVAGAGEGLLEGGSYLETDLEAQSQRKGGLEAYKGEGLEYAQTHAILSGLVGMKGGEAFLANALEGKTAVKGLAKTLLEGAKAEAIEEAVQEGEGRLARRAQNIQYGTDTDYQTWWEDIKQTGKASLMGALGGAPFGGLAHVSNLHYMSEQLQEKFGLSKADAKQLARQYMDITSDAVARNGQAMSDLAPSSRVMQMAKQTLTDSGMDSKQADRTLETIRKGIIKEQIEKGDELSANEFFTIAGDVNELNAYVRDKAGIQEISDQIVEEKKQEISDRRAELEQQAQQETEQVEEKPAEKKATPVQLELNLLNAQENAINEAMDIEAPVLPVQQDLITQEQAEEIKNTIQNLQNQVDELSTAKTPAQTQVASIGKDLNSFTKPKTAESKFATRVAKQAGVDIDAVKHDVRDIKKAKQAADELVAADETSAWDILENDRADTKGLLRSEVAEALKRKIAKTQDPEVRKNQLRRLINAYSAETTRLGQEMRALADDSLVDAIRDVVKIEKTAKEKVRKAVQSKSAKIEKVLDKITKSDKVMSDKKFWEEMREALECR